MPSGCSVMAGADGCAAAQPIWWHMLGMSPAIEANLVFAGWHGCAGRRLWRNTFGRTWILQGLSFKGMAVVWSEHARLSP